MSEKPTIYLVIGVPGSGKSWICEQLQKEFNYVHHDGYIGHIRQPMAYVKGILKAAENVDRPVLAEAPFSISKIKDPLEKAGYQVTPVFIAEHPRVVAKRYANREGKRIPNGHLTRMNTYKQRAKRWGAFAGTSEQALQFLKEKVANAS